MKREGALPLSHALQMTATYSFTGCESSGILRADTGGRHTNTISGDTPVRLVNRFGISAYSGGFLLACLLPHLRAWDST